MIITRFSVTKGNEIDRQRAGTVIADVRIYDRALSEAEIAAIASGQ